MTPMLRPAFVTEIVTPKKYVLRALWFGPKRPKHVIIFLHGLSGSAFSMSATLDQLVDRDTAVLAFNNRGFEWISTLRRRTKGDSERAKGGAAHEVFEDCVDDINGAIRFAKRMGGKRLFLMGHSTGCQKSIYWASKSGARGVAGIVLLGPISDYEAEAHLRGKKKLARARAAAKQLLVHGKKHALLPQHVWHEVMDAQRFLSLYEPDSSENIFPYGRPHTRPAALRAVRIPILVLWAQKDEYTDRPVKEITDWFDTNIKCRHSVITVPQVGHGFKGAEGFLKRAIRTFMKFS